MARVCMSSCAQIGKMRNQKVFRFLLLYNILETVYRVVQATDGRAHGFVQREGELSHFVDDTVFQLPEYIKAEDLSAVSFANLDEENLHTYASPVAFQPLTLDFNNHPVGMPRLERVIIKNLSPDTSIHMLSISGNTLHFHCSFFQEKVISPGGNTSFDVVFLARQVGAIENTLFIHTSLGSFKYQVTAMGTPNPYRLRPFIGVRMPLNSSYSPIVHMHNPYSSTLQLTEMYTSGGDLHLELPDGDNDAPLKVWEIPPYETKPVIKANFIARVEKNHTAFIRIRTNGSTPDYLILPVEVDVSSAPGIYSPTEILDFGILRSQDPPKSLSLTLLNSGQKHIQIVTVIVTPVNEAVDVKFIPSKVPPDTVFSTQIATITFNPNKAFHPKQCTGKIVVKSKNNQFKLHIPYQVELIKGSLDFNKSSTRFYIGQDLKNNVTEVRELNLTNNFNVTIVIYGLSLPNAAKSHFKVSIKDSPIILNPGETIPAIWLKFQPSYRNLQLTTYLRLHTNISYFDVPLLCFSGRLKVFLPHAMNESVIDFGTLGIGDKRTMVFAVINENPVDVNLKLWGSNASKTYVELVGVDKGNASTLVWRQNFSSMAHSLVLKPHHYAIFRIGITAPSYEGILNGHAFVETQYEKINVPFSLRTAKGALKVDDIFFGSTFPGKISTLNLYVHSTFSHSMTVTGVNSVPEDSRFTFDTLKHAPSVLYPNSRNLVGKVHFDLRKLCKHKCYSGLPTTTSMGHQWLLGMSLPPDIADIDKDLFKTLHSRWRKMTDSSGKSVNLSLSLDTTEVRSHLLKASAILQWPRLFGKCSLKFPITQIGNHTVKDFILENPSSLPLIVQMVPLSLYPKPEEVLSSLVERLGGKLINLKHLTADPDVFTLDDLEENNKNPENHIPTYRKSVEEYFGVQSHKQSIVILLTPGMRVRIHVGFTPKDELLRSSLILIRNNLTVLDAFLVQGQGGHGEIKFGNVSPGSDTSLNFELNDKLLKDCDGSKNTKFVSPNFTVRKPFTARNTGALPIYIQGFDINGKPCEGFGFRVLNCEGFELKPNESRRIDIAFTPDFTLTRVERSLNIHTSQGPSGHTLKFMLVATVPRHLLSFCSDTLPRPFWELILYYAFNIITGFFILGILISAHFESQKILRTSFFPLATMGIHSDKIEKGIIFDLKSLSTSSIDNNNIPKNNACKELDTKKSKECSQQRSQTTEYCSSHKRNINLSISKKEFDDTLPENNIRHAKRKSSKLKQVQENYALDPELVEIKKSQPRNSWTHFLKPPFSFNSSQPISKPSVATQTSNDESESALLKEFELTGKSDIENEITYDNSIKSRSKSKKEIKYIDSKNQSKKCIDSMHEEETSSTTTETSTTESDISEKEHQLPDVCVTAQPPKSRFAKNKCRDRNSSTDSGPTLKSVKDSATDAEGFELSTKSRGHKKIKVDPNRAFGNLLHQSSLELPYKPKPVIAEQKKDEFFSSDDSRQTLKNIANPLLKPKVTCYLRGASESSCQKIAKFGFDRCSKNSLARNLNNISETWNYPFTNSNDDTCNNALHQTENFSSHQSFRHNLWPSTPLSENSISFSARSNSQLDSPTSYSAVLSRDISSRNTELPCSKVIGSFKPQSASCRTAPIHPPTSCNYLSCHSSPSSIPSSANTMNSVSTSPFSLSSHTSSNFSESKLQNWISHSNSDSNHTSSTGILHSLTDEDLYSQRPQDSGNLCDTYSPNIDSNIWSDRSFLSMHALQLDHQRQKPYNKQTTYNDWPLVDLPPENVWNSAPSVWNKEADTPDLSSIKLSDLADNMWNSCGSSSSCWETASKVWSSPNGDGPVSPVGISSSSSLCGSMDSNLKNQVSEAGSEFNPFQTLSNLWISPLNSPNDVSTSDTSTSNSTWQFSLFSEPASPTVSTPKSQLLIADQKEEETKESDVEPSISN